MKKFASYKPLIIITTIIAIIAIIVAAFIYSYLHSSTLVIQVAPTNATITINDKTYQNGIFKTKPQDQITATISANGFQTKTINLPLEKHKINQLFTYLVPTNDNWEYYEKAENQESLSILLTNSGYQSWDLIKVNSNLTTDQDNSADTLIKKLSIETITPIQFSICGEPATRSNCDSISINYTYSSECDNQLCLAISGRRAALTPETLNTVKTKMAEKGYNLDNYSYFYQQNDN